MNEYLHGFQRIFILFLVCIGAWIIQPVRAQDPKREFRAVWVATVSNIDWPSEPGLDSGEQQEEILRILDMHRANGINAIILQVRPEADAIYPSEIEPWSRFFSGTQGRAPEPFYDPLEFWIREAHKRGMELHAWFNPYRVSMDTLTPLAEGHPALVHPEWTFTYGGKRYYSPSNPRVWDLLSAVVADVVRRYDIDAVHLDDYFYPYAVPGQALPDSAEFLLLGDSLYPGDLDAWRRHNVDTIIRLLHEVIRAEKPWVKFGISPFGVWRNRQDDPMGSETTAGTTNYDGLYADVIRWQRELWIDYLMPQLYWRDDHPAVGFSTLAYWWNDHDYGRAVYIGLAPYRIDRKSGYRLWRKDKYFLKQIDLLRTLDRIEGFGFFSSRQFFRKDLSGLNRKLQKVYCPHPALVPVMPWIDAEAPSAPVNLRWEGDSLAWDPGPWEDEMNRPRFFALYRYSLQENQKVKPAANLVCVTGERTYAPEGGAEKGVYRVAALDRLGNESPLSLPVILQGP